MFFVFQNNTYLCMFFITSSSISFSCFYHVFSFCIELHFHIHGELCIDSPKIMRKLWGFVVFRLWVLALRLQFVFYWTILLMHDLQIEYLCFADSVTDLVIDSVTNSIIDSVTISVTYLVANSVTINQWRTKQWPVLFI